MSRLLTPQPLSHWFQNPLDQIGCYYNKAKQLIALNDQWKAQKDLPIVLHGFIANLKNDDGILVIAVESSEWATYLHYTQFDLLARLQSWPGLASLEKVQWYVQSPVADSGREALPVRAHTLSQDTKQLIYAISDTLSHPALKKALRQLHGSQVESNGSEE